MHRRFTIAHIYLWPILRPIFAGGDCQEQDSLLFLKHEEESQSSTFH